MAPLAFIIAIGLSISNVKSSPIPPSAKTILATNSKNQTFASVTTIITPSATSAHQLPNNTVSLQSNQTATQSDRHDCLIILATEDKVVTAKRVGQICSSNLDPDRIKKDNKKHECEHNDKKCGSNTQTLAPRNTQFQIGQFTKFIRQEIALGVNRHEVKYHGAPDLAEQYRKFLEYRKSAKYKATHKKQKLHHWTDHRARYRKQMKNLIPVGSNSIITNETIQPRSIEESEKEGVKRPEEKWCPGSACPSADSLAYPKGWFGPSIIPNPKETEKPPSLSSSSANKLQRRYEPQTQRMRYGSDAIDLTEQYHLLINPRAEQDKGGQEWWRLPKTFGHFVDYYEADHPPDPSYLRDPRLFGEGVRTSDSGERHTQHYHNLNKDTIPPRRSAKQIASTSTVAAGTVATDTVATATTTVTVTAANTTATAAIATTSTATTTQHRPTIFKHELQDSAPIVKHEYPVGTKDDEAAERMHHLENMFHKTDSNSRDKENSAEGGSLKSEPQKSDHPSRGYTPYLTRGDEKTPILPRGLENEQADFELEDDVGSHLNLMNGEDEKKSIFPRNVSVADQEESLGMEEDVGAALAELEEEKNNDAGKDVLPQDAALEKEQIAQLERDPDEHLNHVDEKKKTILPREEADPY